MAEWRASQLLRPELERAKARIERGIKEESGTVIVVAGPEGSGRSDFLSALAKDLIGGRTRSPNVLLGDNTGARRVEPSIDAADALAFGKTALQAASAVIPVPLLNIASQAASILGGLGSRPISDDPFTIDRLRVALRDLARRGGCVCLLDDADTWEGRWWSGLLTGFASEINRLPLVVVLTVEGTTEDAHTITDPSDAVIATRDLLSDGLAEWWLLPGIPAERASEMAGPISSHVADALVAAGEGRASWIARIWADWRTGGAVQAETSLAPWQFTLDPSVRSASVADILHRRLDRVTNGNDSLVTYLWQVLQWGALQGRSFTAEAVASVLLAEPDSVIDLIHDYLANPKLSTPQILEDTGWHTIPGMNDRALCRYRFRAGSDRAALLTYRSLPGTANEQAKTLSMALEEMYGGHRDLVANELASLCARAGRTDDAQTYREQVGANMPELALIEVAANLVLEREPDDPVRLRHVIHALRDGGGAAESLGDVEHARTFYSAAASLARHGNLVAQEAISLTALADVEGSSHSSAAAIEHANTAAALYGSIGEIGMQLECRAFAAELHFHTGDSEAAELLLHEALTIARRRREHESELDILLRFGRLLVASGSDELDDLLADIEQVIDNHGASTTALPGVLALRGDAARLRGAHAEAIRSYEQAEQLCLQLDDSFGRHTAQGVRRMKASALESLGRGDEALELLRSVLAHAQAMGETLDEAGTREQIARLQARRGDEKEAQQELRRARILHEELGNHAEAARVAELLTEF